MENKELGGVQLDFVPGGPDRFPRFKRWVVMDSPGFVKAIARYFWPMWMIENELSYILADEIQNEINNEIIKEMMAALKDMKDDE